MLSTVLMIPEFDVHDSMSLTCEGFIPMPAEVPDGDDGGDGGDSTEDRTGVDEDEDSPETADAGTGWLCVQVVLSLAVRS